MQELRKHAFLTHRGLEYRECGQWRIEDFTGYVGPRWVIAEPDPLYLRLWSENRAIWILDEDIARQIHITLERFSRNWEIKRNAVREADNSIQVEGDEDDYRWMSERISFKPYGADERVKDCQLFFPGKAENWDMREDDDPEAIERALVQLQHHFGRSLVYPPGRLATYLMEGCRTEAKEQVDYKRKPSTLEPWERLKQDEDPLDDWKKLRPLTYEEKKMGYVHAFDKNAMYLQCVGVPLALNGYTHIARPAALSSQLDSPGVWRVRSKGWETVRGFRSNYDGKPLYEEKHFTRDFAPHGLKGSEPFDQWVATPTLKLLCELDLITDIEEAYLADDSHKLFSTYYSRIKRGLELCEDSGAYMYGPAAAKMMRRFIKAIYVKGIGYLHSELFQDEWFHRPDWWSTIVAEAGARLFRDAREVWKECHAWPVAVYVDCFYYTSNEPDPCKAYPVFFNRFGSKFKYKGTAPLTPELRDAAENKMLAGDFAGLFKRGVEE